MKIPLKRKKSCPKCGRHNTTDWKMTLLSFCMGYCMKSEWCECSYCRHRFMVKKERVEDPKLERRSGEYRAGSLTKYEAQNR